MDRRSALALAGSAAVTLMLSACASGDSDSLSNQFKNGDKGYITANGDVESIAASKRGAPIEFTATTDRGNRVTAAQFRGHPLVVNFWYAGCPPCRAEASDLQSLYEKFQSSGVQFLGVNLYDSADTARGFEKSFGITYPSVLDRATGSVLLAFSGTVPPKSTPTTLVLDSKGRVSDRILGALPDASILSAMIESALAEAGTPYVSPAPSPSSTPAGAALGSTTGTS